MVSILTNNAAMAALSTLRHVDNQMDQAQEAMSSGLRVQKAKDNAAYWSISTTMKSDHSAISTVADALGLGASLTEVAATGTNAIVNILSSFKAKLVAAAEPGVDRSKIQTELYQLNAQAESIVKSSSFNGENWLQTFASQHLAKMGPLDTTLVEAFTRHDDGAVKVSTIVVNLKTISMLNQGGGGILQKDVETLNDIGGFRGAEINSIAHEGHEDRAFTGPHTFSATDKVQFDMVVDAGAHSPGVTFSGLTIDNATVNAALGTTSGTIATGYDMRRVLDYLFAAHSVPATADGGKFTGGYGAGEFEISSLEVSGHPGSSINVTAASSNFGNELGLQGAPLYNHDNMYPQASFNFTKPFTVGLKAQVFYDVSVGPVAATTITIDRAAVDAALGTTDGYIGNAADFAKVIKATTVGMGLQVVTSGSLMTFSADQTIYPEAGNRAARVVVTNIRSNPVYDLPFDLKEVDVTSDIFTIGEYIQGLDYMLSRAVNSGSLIGSIQKRIDIQSAHVAALLTHIDEGVSRLVDADMNEASTRLKALQAQQQLSIQSLQIANTNAGTIALLFKEN